MMGGGVKPMGRKKPTLLEYYQALPPSHGDCQQLQQAMNQAPHPWVMLPELEIPPRPSECDTATPTIGGSAPSCDRASPERRPDRARSR